jgi:hypothetical protein
LPEDLGISAEEMETILLRRQEDSGQRPLNNDVLSLRAASYARHMLNHGIKPHQYEKVYELAVSIYNESEIKGPFGVDFLIQAAKRLTTPTKEYVVYEKSNKKVLVSCTACQGSKISYRWLDKKIVGINRNEDGTIKKCEDCI